MAALSSIRPDCADRLSANGQKRTYRIDGRAPATHTLGAIGVLIHEEENQNMKNALLVVFCLLVVPPAVAASEYVTASQAADGSVLITLYGTTSCAAPGGVSSGSTTGSNVTITSNFANPGPPCTPSPQLPYSVTSNIGHVPDGTYSVVWSFVLSPPGTSAFATFGGQFTIAAGSLLGPLAVPTMGWPGYLGLALLMLLFGTRRVCI
ncbi:MAG TPA: hypothetical protein VFE23_20145 [Usitatibacter sp.]|jgi:methionine-rich copper-binding protein CopC|nr:hypothetical protein [Usitatibacter sp.]